MDEKVAGFSRAKFSSSHHNVMGFWSSLGLFIGREYPPFGSKAYITKNIRSKGKFVSYIYDFSPLFIDGGDGSLE